MKSVQMINYDADRWRQWPDTEADGFHNLGGVVWIAQHNFWLVVSNQAARTVLSDSKTFRNYERHESLRKLQDVTKVTLEPIISQGFSWIPFYNNGHSHSVLRKLFAMLIASTQREAVNASRDVAEALCKDMSQRDDADFVRDFGNRLYADTLGTALGLPPDCFAWLSEAVQVGPMLDTFTPVSSLLEANLLFSEVNDRLHRLAADNRSFDQALDRFGDCLRRAGLPDSLESRISCVALLMYLGSETVGGTLNLGMDRLLRAHSDSLCKSQWPDISVLTEEFLRLSSAVTVVARIATQDCVLEGQELKAGEALSVQLHAANHDPRTFSCPHGFDMAARSHLAFGAGKHLCVGATLARTLISTALHTLSQTKKINGLAGRAYSDGRTLRNLNRLPIVVEA